MVNTDTKNIKVAFAKSKLSKIWKNIEMSIDEFVHKLENFLFEAKKPITTAAYQNMSKSEKDKLKDGPGFIYGQLKVNNSNRRVENIALKTAASLDSDFPSKDFLEIVKEKLRGFTYLVYSTLSYTLENPRYRLIVFYNRDATPDEGEAVSRRIAEMIGIEQFDTTTFQANRLMYVPTCCLDAEPVFIYSKGDFLDVDGILATYENWRDTNSWPVSEKSQKAKSSKVKSQKNPLEKSGVIGAFCRAYNIHEAIETFLSEMYVACTEDRYTFTGGSTVAGVIVYDDVFTYSNHATDPTSMKLCNAWDLVRIHKFGELDEDVDQEKIKGNKLPSFISMQELVMKDESVKKILIQEQIESAKEEFSISEEDEEESSSINWLIPFGGNGTFKINEILFISQMQFKHDLYYINSEMYGKNGMIPQGEVISIIQDKIAPHVLQGLAKKVADLFKALCNKCYYAPPDPKQDEIYFKNISLKITDGGFQEIASPRFVITRVNQTFDRNVTAAPKWLSFLSCLFSSEDVLTLQEYLGYCFLPTTKAQKAMFIKGGGGEGKSVLINVFQEIFKGNLVKDKVQALIKDKFRLATYENKLLFLDDDLNTAGLTETGLWKEIITSSGKMAIEQKGRDSREGNIFIRYFCVGNEDITSLYDNSDAFYDRLLPLTTLGNKFRDTDLENVNLTEEILCELPSIINWALDGLLRLHGNGYKFTISQQTQTNLKSIKNSNDNVAAFIETCLEFGNYQAYTSDIERAYIQWCCNNCETPKKGFAKAFKQSILESREHVIRYNEKLVAGNDVRKRGYFGFRVSSQNSDFYTDTDQDLSNFDYLN